MRPKSVSEAIELQRTYYANTAARYDEEHVKGNVEHAIALQWLIAMADYLKVRSILDVGSGTGRALFAVRNQLPNVRIVGIEPSSELRRVGVENGLSDDELMDGDAMALAFADGSFDLVCEFGALHHIPKPSKAVSEMLRVARTAIFISDANNFGQGGRLSRAVKQTLNAAGLWPLADWVKTRGKGYTISEGDGLAYSYSAFNDLAQIRKACVSVHLLNTRNSGPNLYRGAETVAILGIKRSAEPSLCADTAIGK
ncbi:MAG: methyltransferase domain-containing protein [Terracidiphilus sp.]|jgi:ubiquinone/menaquinone biosynthesis C-methylase UbiE